MRLSRKDNYVVRVVFFNEVSYKLAVTDITLDEDMSRIILHTFQIHKFPRLSQLVQVYNFDILVIRQHVVDEIDADESSTTGDEICFHD